VPASASGTQGGAQTLGSAVLDDSASYATARRTESWRNDLFFRQTGVDVLAGPSGDVLFPRLQVTNPKGVNDRADFTLLAHGWRLDANRDDVGA